MHESGDNYLDLFRRSRGNAVDRRCQGRKVDAGFDLGQRVAQLVEGLLVMLVGKQVSLDGTTLFIGTSCSRVQDDVILPRAGARRFFEVPKCEFR